jgi:pimeloyl-ACP methyl ester carboxylesterase
MRTVVVYVHGLWLGGGESFLLRRRLSRLLGAECRIFRYPSVRAGVTQNALALGQYLRTLKLSGADTLHLVAHSMGGLVILKLFELGSATMGPLAGLLRALPPGRVVLTGSPVRGSRSAQRLARLPLGRAMLGRTAAQVLLIRGEPTWRGGRDLGVIAGDLGVGLGRVLGRIDGPNDGTVWVDETDLPGATEQIRMHVSHSGMVFSPGVASQVAAFLVHGRFARVGPGLGARCTR